ncbi:MAG: tail fiber domain-containing protein [Bacteroidetes bacterium]|jgi:hypothetical protein|nr:tail fiber domain-containing protein [Bacteroidota bacterium]
MAQYDIVFAINTASSGVLYEERTLKLAKGELLVGSATTPTSLPVATNGKILVYDSSQASGFKAVNYGVFSNLMIEDESIKNVFTPNTQIYLGEDEVIEIISSTSTVYGGGLIDLRSGITNVRAATVKFPNIPGLGDNLFIDTDGSIRRTTISGGSTPLWSVNGADIYRSSKVGIKNASPSYDLDVTGTARATTALYTPKVYASNDTNTYINFLGADQMSIIVGGDEVIRFKEDLNGQYVGIRNISPSYNLDVTGDIHSSGDILSNSDIRLKKNVHPIPDISAKVKKLNPVIFDWKESDKSDIGLIAQEVEQLFPCLVRTDEKGFKSVNYQKLTVLLLKAFQEIM